MKYPTLQKVTLTTMALVASLALSAQAGSPSLSSAVRTHGASKSINPIHSLLFPASTYMIDDGTAEDSVGFGNGSQNFESLWFNQFDVIPGQTSISTVSVAWGTPAFPDALDGTPVTIAVWSDPNGDGNPSDAVLLASMPATIQNANTNTFADYTFATPVDLPAGATSFFVGDMTPMNNGPQHFFQGIDQSSTLHRQSWIAAMSSGGAVDINNPGNNDFLGLIDDFGLPGNWLIRADAGGGTGGDITLTAKARRQGGNRTVALSWTPADGGAIDVLRDGNVIANTADDGGAQDRLGDVQGIQTFTYQVCESDTGVCSNEVTVKVRGSR
ncbi:MAG: hypothetical protein ABI787_00875 [Spartobacteria bacterium]